MYKVLCRRQWSSFAAISFRQDMRSPTNTTVSVTEVPELYGTEVVPWYRPTLP